MIGLEPTFEEHLENLVAVFREVRRVMRPDAVCFLNYGDGYAGSWGNYHPTGTGGQRASQTERWDRKAWQDKNHRPPHSRKQPGLKPKDLMMMPARVAMALQADGFWLRSEIVWHKTSAMPESVQDRPSAAHEKVFLLTKRITYFYDAAAVRTPAKSQYTKMPDGWETHSGAHGSFHRAGREKGRRRGQPPRHEKYDSGHKTLDDYPRGHGANLRNVWSLPTASYPKSHYAVMPPKLAEICIKAGTSEKGCCSECGAPWTRQVKKTTSFESGSGKAGNVPKGKYNGSEQALSGSYDLSMGPVSKVTTTGWNPTCDCNAEVRPCRVLDPFAGAGTSGLVADRLGRDSVMVEISPEYGQMIRDRLKGENPMFCRVEVLE